MTAILRIDASARHSDSFSRNLTDQVIQRLGPDARVVTRDLSETMPQIDEAWVGANFTPPDVRSEDQSELLSVSEEMVAELQAADVLVIGMPVYNFGVPASLKAWVDQVCRPGRTFAFGETGPVGLLNDKKAIIVFVSGSTELGTPADFACSYMKFILGFIGITDVEVISASGTAIDADGAVARAQAELEAKFPTPEPA